MFRKGKTPGPDSICDEYLYYRGPVLQACIGTEDNQQNFVVWIGFLLLQSLSHPASEQRQKQVNSKSYIGISLSATLCKVFEIIILSLAQPILD